MIQESNNFGLLIDAFVFEFELVFEFFEDAL